MTRGLTRELMAMRAARELREGMYVNLGAGIPTMISNFIPEGRDIVLHSENGILGYGRIAEESEWDPDIINASAQPVTLNTGASFFDSALSFAMLRGGHVDVAFLGGFQVSEKGDLANWKTSDRPGGGVGGAMDLAAGAKRIVVLMEHTTGSGEPRIVRECTYPLTGRGVVDSIITNLAVIDVTPEGLVLKEIAPGVSLEEVTGSTGARLTVSKDLKEIAL